MAVLRQPPIPHFPMPEYILHEVEGKTEFGFPVFNRANVFHDRLLGLIARQMQVREEIREEIQHSVRMSA